MRDSSLAAVWMAMAAWGLTASPGQASDTFRLGGGTRIGNETFLLDGGSAVDAADDTPTLSLDFDPNEDADTLDVGRFYGGFRGGFRGGFVGYRGGFARGGFVGYRGWGYRGWGYRGGFVGYRGWGYRGWGYRGWWGGPRWVGGYRGWWGGPRWYGWRGYWGPRVWWRPRVFISNPGFVYTYPIVTSAGPIIESSPPVVVNPEYAPSPRPLRPMPPAPPIDDESDGTFPYNGGPTVPPPPMPMNPPAPTRNPASVTSPTRVASASAARPVFPAYGESLASPYLVRNPTVARPAVKPIYRAYGESKPGQFASERESNVRSVSQR